MTEANATATKTGPPDPLIGRVIADRFRITSLIARGGMGKVYRAEQSPLGRLCAIKVLNPNYNGDADPEFHRRFFREASITSKITHPNSVTIFDYGRTEDEIYFMAMEYLEGQTLHMALRRGGVMDEVRTGRIATQICRAVREAHKLGVIHRDLKPANIFLTRPNRPLPDASGSMPPMSEDDDDFVKVLDFGLVKHLSERPEEQLTQTGLFMGSPKYMAPEQIQGGHVDERTDIYSLGIIMYEMLAGKVPFERATSVNILMAHVGEPPPPMRAVNPNLLCSPAFEEIVMSCIAKDPNERIGSMDLLLAAIRRAHGGSLTGQIASLTGSGPRPTLSSGASSLPRTAVSTGTSSVIGSTGPDAASGSHGSMDLLRAEASNDVSVGTSVMRRRSKWWIPIGVLGAAVMGGGLGLLAFRWSAPAPAPANEPSASVGPSLLPPSSSPVVEAANSAPAAPLEPAPEPSARAEIKKATLEVKTDPPGATIREDGKEVCASTPCKLVFEGAAADPSKVRKLVISRAGYRPETRNVRVSDSPVNVKLVRAWVARPSAPSPSKESPGTVPSGFKELPY